MVIAFRFAALSNAFARWIILENHWNRKQCPFSLFIFFAFVSLGITFSLWINIYDETYIYLCVYIDYNYILITFDGLWLIINCSRALLFSSEDWFIVIIMLYFQNLENLQYLLSGHRSMMTTVCAMRLSSLYHSTVFEFLQQVVLNIPYFLVFSPILCSWHRTTIAISRSKYFFKHLWNIRRIVK